MKDCPTCQLPRDPSEFSRNASRPDGLHGECKTCKRARDAEYQRLVRTPRRREAKA